MFRQSQECQRGKNFVSVFIITEPRFCSGLLIYKNNSFVFTGNCERDRCSNKRLTSSSTVLSMWQSKSTSVIERTKVERYW